MTIFSSLRSIYALDTLDTRFTTDSKTPYRSVIDARSATTQPESARDSLPGSKRSGPSQYVPEPSKWRTTEFYIYYFIFIITVPYMFWIAYDVSRPSDPNYRKYEHLLSPGWVPGRKIDTSDPQYSTFRDNIPYLASLLLLHPLLRRAYERLRPLSSQSMNGNNGARSTAYVSTADGEARLEQRASFDFGFAIVFLIALHGFSSLKVMAILYLNFCIATKLPRRYVPVATWVFNIGVLFANELCEGYKFAKLESFLLTPAMSSDTILHVPTWGAWLDSYGGLIPRWEVLFNITVLRLISFNLDHYWAFGSRAGSPLEKKQLDPANLSERDRINLSANSRDYSFRNYIAYEIYAPLYLAGPILTFNDYISQLKYRPATIETSRTVKYGVRFLMILLSMELLLHFDYCVAISKGNPTWSDYTPAQLCLLSYFNLHVIWLKLLIPWRLFRLWALIDGIDPPENMIRCISNNHSTLAFWRSWHRSYNRWLIRYIYIPLGGSSPRGSFGVAKAILNYVMVFTFVALWHDIQLNLLIWGWLIVFFMLPEIVGGLLFPRKKWEDHLTAYRYLCSVGAVGNIMMMMAANLVGFAIGVDGLKSIISGIFQDSSGVLFLVVAASALFVGIQVMFEIREAEMRKGIYLKC